MPEYIPFESYLANHEKEVNDDPDFFENLLTDAKNQFTAGAARIGRLLNTPESVRNAEILSTDTLKQLQKVTIRNSLNVAKLKMMKDKASEMTLVIDYANSMSMCPALDLQMKPAAK